MNQDHVCLVLFNFSDLQSKYNKTRSNITAAKFWESDVNQRGSFEKCYDKHFYFLITQMKISSNTFE